MKVKVITLYEEKIRIKDDEQPYNDIYYYVSLRRTDDFALILAVLQMERERWNEKKSRWETVKIAREITDLFDDDPGNGVLVRRAIADRAGLIDDTFTSLRNTSTRENQPCSPYATA